MNVSGRSGFLEHNLSALQKCGWYELCLLPSCVFCNGLFSALQSVSVKKNEAVFEGLGWISLKSHPKTPRE